MTLALAEPSLVADLVSVDNAPVDVRLASDFGKYVQGMKKIDEAGVKRQAEADKILAPYEEVSKTAKLAPAPNSLPKASSLSLVRGIRNSPAVYYTLQSLPIRQFLLGNLFRPEGSTMQKFRVPLDILGKALNHLGDFPFKDPNVVRYEKPALFVRGTKSKYVPDEVLPAIGQFFPRFELADIDAGHWVISEKPEDFRQGKIIPFSRVRVRGKGDMLIL